MTPTCARTQTHPHVHACVHLWAVHAGTGLRTHTHTHTQASNPSSAENSWALLGLGKAPNFQLHPCGVLRLWGWQKATPAGFLASGRLLLLTLSRFPGLSHQLAFPRTLPAPASTASPCPSLQDPSPPLKAQLQVFSVEHSLHPQAGAGGREHSPPALTRAFHNPWLQEEILVGLFLKTSFPLEGLGTVPGGTGDIWVRAVGGAGHVPALVLPDCALCPKKGCLLPGPRSLGLPVCRADPRAALTVGGTASGLSHLRAPWKTRSTHLWLHPQLLGRTLKHPAFPEGIF